MYWVAMPAPIIRMTPGPIIMSSAAAGAAVSAQNRSKAELASAAVRAGNCQFAFDMFNPPSAKVFARIDLRCFAATRFSNRDI
jgi:hypothetical protein